VNPGQFGFVPEHAKVQVPFFDDGGNVRQFHLVVFCNPLVTAAISAEAFTIGEVDVKTYAFLPEFMVGFLKQPWPVFVAGFIVPKRNGRIAGISRCRYIVFLDQISIHHQVAIYLLDKTP
jgi:hypothetical protein